MSEDVHHRHHHIIMSPKCIVLYLFVLYTTSVLCKEDLYKVLGVQKSASTAEIKKAYKKLAIKWHPDKSQEPGTEEKFIKINQAYETLGSEKDRRKYDMFGTTRGENVERRGGFQDGFDSGDPFAHFSFNFGGRSESSLHNYRITYRSYMTRILPESKTKPYLVFAYSDFCFRCVQMERIWNKVVDDLITLDLGIGTLHVNMDSALTHKLGVSTVPAIIGVINSRVHWFDGAATMQGFRDFIRSLFPAKLVTTLTDDGYEVFLSGWHDNRVRLVLLLNQRRPPLRLLATAFQHTERVAVAYANLNPTGSEGSTAVLRMRYNVPLDKESLLIFNEDIARPVAYISMARLTRKTIADMMESHHFLALPRISCQAVFNQLCPVFSPARSKRLCVVLLTHRSPSHDEHRTSFRIFAEGEAGGGMERVKYTYVYEDVQKSFATALSEGRLVPNDTDLSLPVVVLWRLEGLRLQYAWLEGGWPKEGGAGPQLSQLVDWVLTSSSMLPLAATLPAEMLDEQADSLFNRIIQRISDWLDALWEKITSVDALTVITAVVTILFVILVGVAAKTAMSVEESRIHRQGGGATSQPPKSGGTVYLHPFGPDNFSRLVANADSGLRTVMVLVDESSRDTVIQRFAHAVYPYSRSAGFVFAFLQLDVHFAWFRALLSASSPSRDLGEMRPDSCVGTVLAINGLRRYYCLFHPCVRRGGRHRRSVMEKILGFSTDDDDSGSEGDGVSVDVDPTSLRGLVNWLDRLCEGSTKRYRVDAWPALQS